MFKLLFVCLLLAKYATPLETADEEKADPDIIKLLRNFLHDVQSHNKTLDEIPKNVQEFLDQFDSPSELIKTITFTQMDEITASLSKKLSSIRIRDLWKRLIFYLIMHKGDSSHLPKPILEYFYNLTKNPEYTEHLDVLFKGLSIDPQLVAIWVKFLYQLSEDEITIKEIPRVLKKLFISMKLEDTEEDLKKISLKLFQSNLDPSVFVNVDTCDKLIQLWKTYIKNVAENKGNVTVPRKLRNHFKEIISNPTYVEYIKVLFAPGRTDGPLSLNTWGGLLNTIRNDKSTGLAFSFLFSDFGIIGQTKDWTLTLQDINPKANGEELKDFLNELASSKDLLELLVQLFAIKPDLLENWKRFMKDLKQHTKSLTTMPDDLKSQITDIKNPIKFIRLINSAQDFPVLYATIPKPDNYAKNSWRRFTNSLKEKPNLDKDKIDNVRLMDSLVQYIRTASNDTNYQKDVQYIFQLDHSVIEQLEQFKENMTKNYSLTLTSMPTRIYHFISQRFKDPIEGFRALLAAYPGDNQLNIINYSPKQFVALELALLNAENKIHWIPFKLKQSIENLTKGTIIEKQVTEIFQIHDSNHLISTVERLWKETIFYREHSFKKYAEILNRLGDAYNKTDELCGRRSGIIEALDKIKSKFTSSIVCQNLEPQETNTAVVKLWTRTKDENEVHDGLEVFLKFLHQLEHYYLTNLEQCDRGSTFMDALDNARNGFASYINCTLIK